MERLLRALKLSAFRLGILLSLVFCLLKWFLDEHRQKGAEPFLARAENLWLDTKFLLRGAEDPDRFQQDAHVVIAAIDEKSVREPDLGLWPWPRQKVAEMVRQLHRCGAKVIGFDMVFAEPDASRLEPELQGIYQRYLSSGQRDESFSGFLEQRLAQVQGDRLLAEAIEDAGNVVLGYFFFLDQSEIANLKQEDVVDTGFQDISYSALDYRRKSQALDEPQACRCFPQPLGVRTNLKLLSEATDSFGFFNQIPDDDRIYRRVPLVFCFQQEQHLDSGETQQVREYLPSLALRMLSLWYGQPIELLIGIDRFEQEVPDYLGLFIGPIGMPGREHVEIPLESGARFRVNYYGGQKTFRHLSAGDLIHLEGLEPESLSEDDPRRQACRSVRDKIVLVGATTVGIYDMRPTPFEHSFPGVEIHANFIENVLRGDFLVRPLLSPVLEPLFMLLLGILLSWALSRLRLTVGLLLALATLAALVLGDFFLFFKNGLQVHIILSLSQVVVLLLGISIFRYATEEREKHRIRHAFQLYLSQEVIEEVLRDTHKLKLGGERREVTVIFSDIRGFTSLSENMPPDLLTEFLNEYFTPMTEIVLAEHGTLDKYIGDALMAFFGAPVAFGDHPHAACRTSLRMLEELERLHAGWRSRGLAEIKIGIGINTGEVSVGNMGSARRFDYTVIGDNVNLASRLEGLNKTYGTSIITTEFTRQAVGEHFTFRELDLVRVKGKARPVKIYELLHRGPPDPVRDGWLKQFEAALDLYQGGRWGEAGEVFAGLTDDPASALFLERCRQMEQAPPENWDGVYKFLTK